MFGNRLNKTWIIFNYLNSSKTIEFSDISRTSQSRRTATLLMVMLMRSDPVSIRGLVIDINKKSYLIGALACDKNCIFNCKHTPYKEILTKLLPIACYLLSLASSNRVDKDLLSWRKFYPIKIFLMFNTCVHESCPIQS